MATHRKSAPSRSKGKQAARPAPAHTAKASKGAAAKVRPAKAAPTPSRPAPKLASKPAAKLGIRPAPKLASKPAAKLGIRPAPKLGIKPLARPAFKPSSRFVGKPALAGGKAAPRPKSKAAPRPPAVVRPMGVLPPESISRAPQKPARPLPVVKPAKPSPKSRKEAPAEPGAQKVTAKDFQEFEERLREERARVLKEMGHYETTVLKVNQRESAGDLSGYSFHMADVGTDAMEREKAFQLASAEGRILLEINEALRRMARGEYGVCETCEKHILRARLEAMPTARLCLPCKEQEERVARGIS